MSSPSSAPSSTSATRAAARPGAGDTTIDSYGTQVPADRVPGHLDHRHRQRHRHREARPRRSARSRSGCTRRRCTSPATRCSSPTPTATPSRSSTPPATGSCRRSTTQPWPSSNVGYEPTSIALTTGRPPAGHPGPGQRRRRLPATTARRRSRSSYVGLLPTDYYPADIATVGGQVVVTNTRGIDARGPELTSTRAPGTVAGDRPRHAQHHGVADPFPLPGDTDDRRRTPPRSSPERVGHQGRREATAQGGARRRYPSGSVTRRRSSTSSCWSRRTAPTTRCTATTPAGNGDPYAGAVRREGHAQPARAGQAVRALRQLLRHRHQLRRGPQLADAGRQPRVHRVLRR